MFDEIPKQSRSVADLRRDQFTQQPVEKEPVAKIGATHAAAMGRMGLEEFRSAFYPESNIVQPTEYGIWGTKTPGEVADERRPDASDSVDERRSSILHDTINRSIFRTHDRSADTRTVDVDR